MVATLQSAMHILSTVRLENLNKNLYKVSNKNLHKNSNLHAGSRGIQISLHTRVRLETLYIPACTEPHESCVVANGCRLHSYVNVHHVPP